VKFGGQQSSLGDIRGLRVPWKAQKRQHSRRRGEDALQAAIAVGMGMSFKQYALLFRKVEEEEKTARGCKKAKNLKEKKPCCATPDAGRTRFKSQMKCREGQGKRGEEGHLAGQSTGRDVLASKREMQEGKKSDWGEKNRASSHSIALTTHGLVKRGGRKEGKKI